jgi:hypothetical protein
LSLPVSLIWRVSALVVLRVLAVLIIVGSRHRDMEMRGCDGSTRRR